MQIVITSQEIEPLSKPGNDIVNKPLGFLNSNYQKIVSTNFNTMQSNSIFGIKQRLKSRQYNTSCTIETILKVSLFFILFILYSS